MEEFSPLRRYFFHDRSEYEKMTCSATRKIFQQGEPSLRISAAMTRRLHSSTLFGPDEMRACFARARGCFAQSMTEPLRAPGCRLTEDEEARRADAVVGTVARFTEVCRYVKINQVGRQRAGTAVSMKDGRGQARVAPKLRERDLKAQRVMFTGIQRD